MRCTDIKGLLHVALLWSFSSRPPDEKKKKLTKYSIESARRLYSLYSAADNGGSLGSGSGALGATAVFSLAAAHDASAPEARDCETSGAAAAASGTGWEDMVWMLEVN